MELLDRPTVKPIETNPEARRLRRAIEAAVGSLQTIDGEQDVESQIVTVCDQLQRDLQFTEEIEPPLNLAAVEKRHILAVLGATAGYKPTAAQILGISLKTLYNKLNQYQEQAAQAE